MKAPIVTVIIPTRNRIDSLAVTVLGVGHQDMPLEDFEVVVVDDGSSPPVPTDMGALGLRIVRLEGKERSAARNAGMSVARGEILVFLDDDLTVGPGFLSAHVAAQKDWPGVLAVGRIVLPEEGRARPFLRFRSALERQGVPDERGIVARANFCAAGNMSIRRDTFIALGGFDPSMSSGEDQDLALRHTAAGGKIAYVPEAVALHRDDAVDLARYCRRAEWGSEHVIPFCRRHPGWPDNEVRERVNGPIRWRQESLTESVRKAGKVVLALPPATWLLMHAIGLVERMSPPGALLDQAFRAAVGVHLFRGYRKGLKRFPAPPS